MDFDVLTNKPEPQRSIMIGWGLAIHNGEAKADELNHGSKGQPS